MPYAWVWLAIVAAAFQTGRNTTSRALTKTLKPNTVSFVRFFFSLPLSVTYLAAVCLLGRESPGGSTTEFWAYISLSALFQILGSTLLVALLSSRSFGTAVTLSRTEAVQAAILGALLFSERPSVIGWCAIVVSTVGVLLLSAKGSDLKSFFASLATPTALMGLACGGAFGVAVTLTPFAIRALEGGNVVANAAFALVVMSSIQSLIIFGWLMIKEPQQIEALRRVISPSIATGALSALGSLAWFTAFTLAPPPYVRTVGQIELIFSACLSRFAFKERMGVQEFAGMVMTGLGIISLLLDKGGVL